MRVYFQGENAHPIISIKHPIIALKFGEYPEDTTLLCVPPGGL
jgi:hypothetical protein